VYFGDDDNVYDWKLFDEIRSIDKVGVWPVGLVGGQLVETPLLSSTNKVIGFNAAWKPRRPFPIDMAAFSVNISLVNDHPKAQFSYNVSRGYQVIKVYLKLFNSVFRSLTFLLDSVYHASIWNLKPIIALKF
jgi:galactosylgalactosylxylosylprotein 3-beta-glucuronosyltransferase 3